MPEKPPFRDVKACVFDAYGTLFDVHSALEQFRQRLGETSDPLSALWRAKQLEYTWLRSLMKRHADFWQVTQDALDYALEKFRIRDERLRAGLLNAYLRLACYAEVREALEKLKARGLRLAILSNGSPAMLESAIESSGLEDLIGEPLSAEEVGVYKPDPRVYEIAVRRLAVPAKQVAFHSSNAWDAAGAAAFGFRVVWINRSGQLPERLPAGPDVEIPSLAEAPALFAS